LQCRPRHTPRMLNPDQRWRVAEWPRVWYSRFCCVCWNNSGLSSGHRCVPKVLMDQTPDLLDAVPEFFRPLRFYTYP
jgi:hypothetical protein